MVDYKNWRSLSRASQGGSADWNPEGHRPRQKSSVIRVLVVAGFLALAVASAVLLAKGVGWTRAHSPDSTVAANGATSRSVTVEGGMTASQIGALLEEQGIIASSAAFVDLVTDRASENKLQPGKYTFEQGLQLIDIVDMLEQGSSSSRYKVLIPEGLAISQIKARLDAEGKLSGTEYEGLSKQLAALELPSLAGVQVTGVKTVEGLLFPATYFLYEGQGAADLMKAQLAAFTNNTSALPWEKAKALDVTPYQIVIIGSMIEKEVKIPAERAKVARVIYNRLARDMRLDIDATVRYALDKWTGALTDADLAVDSPYNTRRYKGLPPAPICSPGEAALRAALEPVAGDWLYYLVRDSSGNHDFFLNLEDFNQAKANMPTQ
jgi:UPF0755 protein